jgi:hypothetical protein
MGTHWEQQKFKKSNNPTPSLKEAKKNKNKLGLLATMHSPQFIDLKFCIPTISGP